MTSDELRLMGELKRIVSTYLNYLGYDKSVIDTQSNISEDAERFVSAGLMAVKGCCTSSRVISRADVSRLIGVTVQTVARYGKMGYIQPVKRPFSGRTVGYDRDSVREYLSKYVVSKR